MTALVLVLLATQPGDEALAFEAAYEADGDPKALLQLAEAYAAWPGHCVDARRSYERYLAACGEACEAGRAGLAALRARCVAKLEVETAPSEATVRVGATVGPAPLTVELWPGVHRAVVSADGFAQTDAAVCVDAGAPQKVTVAAGQKPQTARDYEDAAFGAINAGDHCEGVAELERAYALAPEPGFLFNVAAANALWPGRCPQTVAAFDRYLAVCPDCEQAAAARARREEVRGRCVAEVKLLTEPPGARLKLDGSEAGRSPALVSLMPGRHEVVAVRSGYRMSRRKFHVSGPREVTIELALEDEAPARPPVVVVSPVEPEPVPLAPWGWSAVGLGAAGLAAGGVFLGLALDAEGRFDEAESEARSAPDSQKGDVESIADEHDRYGTLAYVGFGVGATLAVVGGLLLWLDDAGEGSAFAPAPGGGAWTWRF